MTVSVFKIAPVPAAASGAPFRRQTIYRPGRRTDMTTFPLSRRELRRIIAETLG